jgi:hypothetical protein
MLFYFDSFQLTVIGPRGLVGQPVQPIAEKEVRNEPGLAAVQVRLTEDKFVREIRFKKGRVVKRIVQVGPVQ